MPSRPVDDAACERIGVARPRAQGESRGRLDVRAASGPRPGRARRGGAAPEAWVIGLPAACDLWSGPCALPRRAATRARQQCYGASAAWRRARPQEPLRLPLGARRRGCSLVLQPHREREVGWRRARRVLARRRSRRYGSPKHPPTARAPRPMNACFPCPCCGYRTLNEQPPGTFGICPVCYWEDDPVQYADPDLAGGANEVSLSVARRNFAECGAAEERFRQFVRPPLATE